MSRRTQPQNGIAHVVGPLDVEGYNGIGNTSPPLQGKFSEAEPLSLRSIEIKEKTVGPDHPSRAASLNTLAELFQAQVRAYVSLSRFCDKWAS